MSQQVSVRIDGELCTATEGQTILRGGQRQRTLHPRALPHGRLELGRVLPVVPGRGGGRRPAAARLHDARPAAACRSPPIRRTLAHHRLMALELLFVERNHICAVCVSNGHCELQALAQKLGLTHVRFPYNYPRLPVDTSHPRFVLDHNRCVLCSRCVRVCDEIEGAHVWDIAARGIHSVLVSDLDRPWGESRDLHQLRQVRSGLPDRRAGREGPRGRGNDQAERRRHAARRRRERPTHEKGETGHDVARRLLRLPHVPPRHRRGDHRRRAAGGHRLRAAGRRAGVSSTTSTSPSSRAPSAARTISRRSSASGSAPRILVALGDCADHQQCSVDAQSASGEDDPRTRLHRRRRRAERDPDRRRPDPAETRHPASRRGQGRPARARLPAVSRRRSCSCSTSCWTAASPT